MLRHTDVSVLTGVKLAQLATLLAIVSIQERTWVRWAMAALSQPMILSSRKP